jgi:hypothetical protein
MNRRWKEYKEFEKMRPSGNENKRNKFPKKVGIIFLEELYDKRSYLGLRERVDRHSKTCLNSNKSKIYLNFDQLACAHFLLQMNSNQSIFDFQIIAHEFGFYSNLPRKKDKNIELLKWFNKRIDRFNTDGGMEDYGIDYWIGITSEQLLDNREFLIEKDDKTNNIFSLITSDVWETLHSPPSLFEYLAITVIVCSLISLNLDFNGPLGLHGILVTKGCIFDFTTLKPHRRILVSNPTLCNICKERLSELQKILTNLIKKEIPLYDDILKLLSREWMGSIEKTDSPIYNLKKNYGYHIDVHSGFYKKWWEYIRDNIRDNSTEWIVTGLISMIFLLIGNYLNIMFNLSQNS